jgi:CRP-like cAMP-binding protein
VLLNSTVSKVLPTAINHLAQKNKQTLEALLCQLSKAVHAPDKNLKIAASSCLIATSKLLADGSNWDQLKKIAPTIKLVAGKEVFPEQTRKQAGKICRNLELIISGKSRKTGNSATDKDPVANEEERIFKIAESGQTEPAKKELIKLIISCARKRDFFNAERLRDRIYEIDPMVVMEIIQLNELIDTEKSKSIGKHDLEKWTELRENLSEDEFSRLFYAMELRSYKADTTFVSEGDENDELYFINFGVVNVSYKDGERERTLKTLETGDIFGENFFDSSYWTVSLTAMELTKVLVLKRKVFDELEKVIPELEETLVSFYKGAADLEKLIHLKKIERRKHERYKLDRKVHVQISGKNATHFKAALRDISQGGLCFIIRITNRKNVRQLLSKNTTVGVPPATGSTNKFLRGTIIGVQLLDSITCDCSVHVKFSRELDYEAFKIFLY